MEIFTFKLKIVKTEGKHSRFNIELLNRDELEMWRLSNLMTMIEAAKCFKMSMRTYQGLASGTQKNMATKCLKIIKNDTEHKVDFVELPNVT